MAFDTLPSLNFPASPLDIRVELGFTDPAGGGTYPDLYPDLYPGEYEPAGWTDITRYVERDQLAIQRGHPDESTTTSPTVLNLTLQNGDGRFTNQPLSPYYPYLRRNTQCRVSLPEGASYLRLEGDQSSYASAPSTSGTPGSFVQSKSGTGTGTSLTVTLSSPTTAGNLLVVAIRGDGSGSNPTVGGVTLGGAAGNFASDITAGTAPFTTGAIWSDPNCAGGQTAVAVTTTGGSGTITIDVVVYEFTAMANAHADKTATNGGVSGTSTSWSSGATATLTQANEVAVGLDCGGATALVLTGPSSPWVNTNVTNAGNTDMVAGYNILSSAAGVTYAGTASPASASTAIVATFKAASSGGGTNITGDLELQLDVTLDNWQGAQTLACKWNQSGNERSWLLEVEDGGTLGFWVSSAGSDQTSFFSTLAAPSPPLLRQCLRVTYQASTGTATFYTAPPGLTGVSWTQLGTAVVNGALSPFGCTAPVLLGARTDGAGFQGMNGKIHAALLLSGIGGTTVASPDFTAQTPGATSFTDGQSNTWTLNGTSEISNRKYRCHVEVPQWAQNQDPSGHSVYAQVQGGGLLRRMAMGQTPARSPMERAYLRSSPSLHMAAVWPAEDGAAATQIGATIGTFPMGNAGLTMASFSGFACSAPLPVMNGATINAAVSPSAVTWSDNVVRFLLALNTSDDTPANNAIIARFYTQGAIARVDLRYGTGGSLQLLGYDATGTQQFASPTAGYGLPFLALCRVSMELRSNNTWGMWVTMPGGTINGFGGSFSGTIGAVTGVQFGGGLVSSAMGHFSVQGVWDTLQDLASPLNAWYGETAASRFARLCGEEGIACRIRGQASASAPMGFQSIQTIDQLLQECVDADLGTWWELRQALGFGYRTRQATGNMDSAVTVSFDADNMEIWSSDPTADDQIIVNDVTVTQTADSSSAHLIGDAGQVIDGGTMGVSLIGRYDQSYPANVPDSSLGDNAGTRLRAGTVDEPRYPGIAIDLANFTLSQQGLILPLLDMDMGDRLTMQFPPGWLPPGTGNQIDQVMNGVLETLWVARILGQAWQGIPWTPWSIGVVGDPFFGWVDTDGSTVHANASYGAGTIQIDTTGAFPVWSQTGSDYPVLLISDGMVIQASWQSGTSSPQTFTVNTWGVNGVVKNLIAGHAISLAYPAYAGM